MSLTKATNTCFKYSHRFPLFPPSGGPTSIIPLQAQMMNFTWKAAKDEKNGKRNYNCGIRAEWINVNETKEEKENCSFLLTASHKQKQRNNSWCKKFFPFELKTLLPCGNVCFNYDTFQSVSFWVSVCAVNSEHIIWKLANFKSLQRWCWWILCVPVGIYSSQSSFFIFPPTLFD